MNNDNKCGNSYATLILTSAVSESLLESVREISVKWHVSRTRYLYVGTYLSTSRQFVISARLLKCAFIGLSGCENV